MKSIPPLCLTLTLCISADAFTQPTASLQRLPSRLHDVTSRNIKTTLRRRPSCLSISSNNSDVVNQDDITSESQQQKDKLTREFFKIAVPAFFQLAAEPLAGLVDTAYLGRLGPEVLGGAGVAISAQYAVSKLYNDPLLRTSISLVASEDGKANDRKDNAETKSQALSIAVSSALLLAFTVGMIQLVLYFGFASAILRGMGVTSTSTMYYSAFCKFHYLDKCAKD